MLGVLAGPGGHLKQLFAVLNDPHNLDIRAVGYFGKVGAPLPYIYICSAAPHPRTCHVVVLLLEVLTYSNIVSNLPLSRSGFDGTL